jgi:hypothetical protein
MNFLKKHFYLFSLLLLLTFGCRSCDTVESTKIAQSEIFQDYAVEAGPGSTVVSATFRVGGGTGTTVDLDAPSRVDHNGAEMAENSRTMLAGTYYSFSAGEFIGRHEFAYTNGEGRVFRNVIELERIDPLLVPSTLGGNGKVVILLSRPVREDESFETMIVSETTPPGMADNANADRLGNTGATDTHYSINLYQNYGSTRNMIEIEPGALKNFVPGKARLSIRVVRNGDLQEKNKTGGSMRYTYTSGAYNVTVIPVSRNSRR